MVEYMQSIFQQLPPLKETYDVCYPLAYFKDIQCPVPAGKRFKYYKQYKYTLLYTVYTHCRKCTREVFIFKKEFYTSSKFHHPVT